MENGNIELEFGEIKPLFIGEEIELPIHTKMWIEENTKFIKTKPIACLYLDQ